jgi:hypothetical protein
VIGALEKRLSAIELHLRTNVIEGSAMLRLALLVQSGATGWERFAVFSVVAFAVFASVLRLALRTRDAAIWPKILVAGVFIVFGGMLFAPWTYGPGLPWWIFYVLMAPAIHVFFSFFVGWHDYMPLFYVRSVWDLLR